MVPHWADASITLKDDVTIPKGTLVMPSLVHACQEGWTEPEKFDPERWDENGRNEGVKFAKNFLPFGCGPHYCVGREYAMNHLAVFLSIIATHCDFTRKRTEKSDEIIYLPTIYPADCLIDLKQRA